MADERLEYNWDLIEKAHKRVTGQEDRGLKYPKAKPKKPLIPEEKKPKAPGFWSRFFRKKVSRPVGPINPYHKTLLKRAEEAERY